MANPIDIITAKGKGIVRSMEAHRDGLIGVFQTLAKQHAEAVSLIDRVKNDATKRDDLWPKINAALVAHEKAEMKVVYPALGWYAELHQRVEEHAEEAKELDAVINRLDAMNIESDEWMSLFDTLGDMVVSHAAEEENETFPIALNMIGADLAKQLDERFKAAHKEFETASKREVH